MTHEEIIEAMRAACMPEAAEFPVTPEMYTAGCAASLIGGMSDAYRAMARLAPPPHTLALYAASQTHAEMWAARNGMIIRTANYGTELMADAHAIFDGAQARVAELEAENEKLRDALPPDPVLFQVVPMTQYVELESQNRALKAALDLTRVTIGDPTPADLPDPPRRPDGTLLPQPKPWSAPKSGATDSRRVGS